MRILTLALVSLLALARLTSAPLPAASSAEEAPRSPLALLDGDGKGGGDGGDDDDDKDDDDEDFRVRG